MKTYKPYYALCFILFLGLALFFWNRLEDKITINNPVSFNQGWIYETKTISLPIDLDVPKNQTYQIYQVLDEAFHEPQYLMIRTSLQNITVYLDGNIIYEKSYGNSLSNPYASMWHFVRLPRHIDGQTLMLEFSSPYTAMSGQINEIFYGTEAMHFTYLYRTYGVRLALGIIAFMIGFLVMISNFIFSKKDDRGYSYAGLFVILLSLWMLAESRMIQFFSGSHLFIGSIAYLLIPLVPIPLIGYLNDYVIEKYKKPLYIMRYLFFIQFGLVALMYVFNVLDFFESVVYSQLLMLIGIFILIYVLYLEIIKESNQKALKFTKIFGFLVIFVILEFINFALRSFDHTSVFLSIGFSVISIGLLYNYVKYLVSRLKISYETELYEKLAFMDHVTQGQNRLAFERDLDSIFKDPSRKENVRLISFDLDDLKAINDAYGHIEGDKAIKKAFDMITEAFQEFGSCYRIGGDEFACLYEQKDELLYHQQVEKLIKNINQYELDTPYHFGLSLGSSIVNSIDMTQEDLIHLADLEMYKFKKLQKSKKT